MDVNDLPGGVTAEEIEHWAREAEKHHVRVTYRVVGQQIPTTKTMGFTEYLRWVRDLATNGYELLRAEQTTVHA